MSQDYVLAYGIAHPHHRIMVQYVVGAHKNKNMLCLFC